MIAYLDGLWFIIPAYFATSSAVFFGRIFPHPVDFNHNFFDNQRIFGNGKTYGGSIGGIIMGGIIGLLQGYLNPGCFNFAMNLEIGLLIAFGAIIGDLGGSFIKRRVGIKQGGNVLLLDQLDFVIGALAVGYLINVQLTVIGIILIIVITPVFHRTANYIAFKFGWKDVWW